MNKQEARKIAEVITNEQLVKMFENAKKGIKNWRIVSNINGGMTKGASWNIYGSEFDVTHEYSKEWKVCAIREFGEFLPKDVKIQKRVSNIKHRKKSPVHQDPVFWD